MKNLLAIDTIEFFVDFLPTFIGIVIALAVIAFVIIAVIVVKNRRKAAEVPEEDEQKDENEVPEENEQKDENEVPEENEQKDENEVPEENEQKDENAEVPVAAEEQPAEENAEDEDEDKDEEITFEADDVESEEKADEGAKEHKEGGKRKVTYRILYDKESKTWEVRKDNAKRVIRRVKTKKEALEIAQELSKNQDVNLVVHKKDGKFQKKENWSRNISSGDSENK